MSTFKITKKNALSDNRTNIYDLHEKKLDEFKQEKNKLNNYIEQRNLISKEYQTKNTPELLKKISELDRKIDDINSNTDQTKYLLDFLCVINKNNYLINNNNDTIHKANNKVVHKNDSNIKMDTFVTTEINTFKSELYNDYVRNFYPSLTQISVPKQEVLCKLCKSDRFICDVKNGNEVCINCGFSSILLVAEDPTQTFNENIEHVNVFNYKRHNHFQECLNQLQAKENTTIPTRIIKDLTEEFKKYNITDRSIITPVLVKSYLKKLKYNKYYEHIPTIINEICGIDAPKMDVQLEEQLKIMFDEIQIPFEKYSKLISPDRKNFLNYNYILYKMCELLNRDEFLLSFPLLKSREKLYEHDLIWKGICTDLRWEYIPSI